MRESFPAPTHKQVCPEYLGDIYAELMLQNLTNTNLHYNTIDELRFGLTELAKAGVVLTVVADYKYEWSGNPKTTKPTSRRFVRLIVEPDVQVQEHRS